MHQEFESDLANLKNILPQLSEIYTNTNELVVADNYIYIINFTPPEIFGILTEDKHIAQLHKILFENLWKRKVAARE